MYDIRIGIEVINLASAALVAAGAHEISITGIIFHVTYYRSDFYGIYTCNDATYRPCLHV